nr:hypothetical protein [Burkholderia sp. Ac-20345]
MDTEKTSLRSLVEKWFAPTSERPLRVTRFGRMPSGVRFACIEARRNAGPMTIVFFYHGDGAWRVFPPRADPLRMKRAHSPVVELSWAI